MKSREEANHFINSNACWYFPICIASFCVMFFGCAYFIEVMSNPLEHTNAVYTSLFILVFSLLSIMGVIYWSYNTWDYWSDGRPGIMPIIFYAITAIISIIVINYYDKSVNSLVEERKKNARILESCKFKEGDIVLWGKTKLHITYYRVSGDSCEYATYI